MSFRTHLCGLATAGVVSLFAMGADALPILQPDLVIVDGDKEFSNFSCSTVAVGNTTGGCDSIEVDALSPVSPTGEFGLIFQDALFSFTSPTSFLDLLIGYTVTVTDPSQEIDAISLFFNGNVSGVAVTNVTETVRNSNGDVIGLATVLNPGFPPVLNIVIPLDENVQVAHVTKDIGLAALDPGGIANISVIEQGFQQTQVPEPATLGILGAGLVGIGVMMRRRQKKA